MIGAIYQGGKFRAFDTQQTALALSCYAVGLAGYSALKVLNPAFYALHDARTPMIISLISIAVNYVTATVAAAHQRTWATPAWRSPLPRSRSSALWRCSRFLRTRIGGIYGRSSGAAASEESRWHPR